MTCALASGAALGEDIDLRLHIDWQSREAKHWDGRISIDDGQFSDLGLLGFDAATPGSIVLRRPHLIVQQTSKQKYNGAIVTVSGSDDARLRFEFVAGGDTQATVFGVDLKELVGLNGHSKSFDLDPSGSRLLIRRAPGDQIRVSINRPNLVFAPGDSWKIDISPAHLSSGEHTPQECRLELVDAIGKSVWSDSRMIGAPVNGEYEPLRNVDIGVPDVEGVYLLKLKLIAPVRRLPPFGSEKTLASRAIQFVVISNERPESLGAVHRIVSKFDPTEHRWWDRLKLLPQWSILPGLRRDGSISNRKSATIRHGDAKWISIPIGGWQAFPLPVDMVNQRHELTIEYPGDLPQTTTFSIVEPDAAGRVFPIGLDSGVRVEEQDVHGVGARPDRSAKHKIPFWPRTKSPLLLVANVDPKFASVVGRIAVSQSPATSSFTPAGRDQRKLIASFDRPLFLENFSANERADSKSRRSFEDWSTFYDGCRRMVEHLRRNGFDAVALTCFAEGSSLFPDDSNHSTPKYDRGIFFSDGRDPVRKDVLEMLLRICERDGVEVIPSFEFSARLHALEMAAQDVRSTDGIRLVNHLGQTLPEAEPGTSVPVGAYNPLDRRVQQAIVGVVRDVAKRYGRHKSFGGIRIILTRGSFTQLPGIEWGMDRVTLRRFRSESSAKIRDPMTDLQGARADTLSAAVIDQWRTWRCRQIADFYGRVQTEILRETTHASVFLSMTDLLSGESLTTRVGESPIKSINIDRELRNFGIDLQLLAKKRGLVVPQPRRLFSKTDLHAQATDIELNHSAAAAARFREMPTPATQFHHQPIQKHLRSFDELSPFGKDKTHLSLVAHVAPSGARYRERFAHGLARNDSHLMIDGGWMLPLGQDESLRAFAAAYRSLPAAKFDSIGSSQFHDRIRPLTIRKRVHDGETMFYIVNDSPWHVGADLHFQSSSNSLTMRSLGLNRPDRLDPVNGGYEWNLNIKPYELIATAMSTEDVTLVFGQTTLPPDVRRGLEKQIAALMSRARYLSRPVEYTTVANSNFESTSPSQLVSSWQPSPNTKGRVQLTAGYESAQSMRLSAMERPLEIRSEAFTPPKSNRIAVEFYAKQTRRSRSGREADSQSNARQLRLQVAIEQEGAEIVWKPSDFRVDPLTNGWQRVILPLRDLPHDQSSDGETASLNLNFKVPPNADIQIDNVRVFDTLLLNSDELRALSNKKISLPSYMLRHGFYGDCNRFLNSYWPQYLMEFVPEASEDPPKMTRRPTPKRKPLRTSDTWRRYIPRLPGLR